MGSVNLDNTGSGSAITLSSDGTSLLLDGTAIGGGGGGSPDLFAENYDGTSTKPSATGLNAIALGYDSVASGTKSLVLLQNGTASGNRALSAGFGSTASGTNSVAFGSGAVASGNYSYALGSSTDSTHSYSVAMGYSSQALADYSIALGRSHVSGEEGFAAQIGNSSTSYGAFGANSISMGYLARAGGQYSIAIGNRNFASATTSVSIGEWGTASAIGAITLGSSCIADGDYSSARGSAGHTDGIRKKHAVGLISTMQGAYFVLGHNTTNATPIALNTSTWTPSATNQITLLNNSAITFSGTVVARQQSADGTASAAWKVEGLIRREANAGSTVLVASTVTAISNTPSWGLALTADTSFGCLKIEATGASSTDIRWVATINTSEVTYA